MKTKQGVFAVITLALVFSGAAKASVLCVFEDDPNFLLKYKQSGADFAGELVIDANDAYTGHSSIVITPNQLLSSGFVIPIRQNPGKGEYRYLTMAWKKKGGKHLIIQFHGEYNGQKKMQVYHAGSPVWTPTRELAAVPPTEWTTYEGDIAIDLYKEIGDCNVSAIVFSPLDGEYAQFDHIYFTGTQEEAKSLIQPAHFIKRAIADVKGKVKDIESRLAGIDVHSSFWKKSQKQTAKLFKNINAMYKAIEQKDFNLSQNEMEDFNNKLTKYSEQIEKQLAPAVYKAVLAAHMQKQYGVKDADYAVVVASTMQKFFKDEQPDLKDLGKIAAINLAGNEYEGFQLLLVPIVSDLQDVKISASDLRQVGGKGVINSKNIQISPVGYVETQKPVYAIHPQRIGWWPDPLLANKSFNVLASEIQPIWITVYASENTPAGQYNGQIIVESKNARLLKVPVSVTVWDFALPVTPRLKTAFTFSECIVEQWYMSQLPEDARKEWYLFILKHKLNPQTLYPSNEAYWSYRNIFKPLTLIPFEEGIIPRKKDMEFCVEHGLNLFNVGVGYPELARQEKLFDFNKKLEEHLKSYAAYLAEKGWSDKGFLYAFDEIFTRDEEDLRRVRDFLAKLKVLAPDFKRAATLSIDKEKIDKMAGYLDIYIPLSAHYNEELFAGIKQQGAEAWWYVCNVPTAPWPTFSPIESPALDARILFWMNWKYQIPGVLYHNLNGWGRNICSGGKNRWPMVPWITQEIPEYNGDGYLIYPGEKMDSPLSSIRLENVRDGIEDYDYFSILKDKIDAFKAKGGDMKVIGQFEILLTIDDPIAKNQTEHTADPYVLLKRRELVAQAIEQTNELLK